MTKTGLVCIFLMFDKLLGLYLIPFLVQGCRFCLDALLAREGLGDLLWFSPQSSNHPVILHTPSQEQLF